MRPGISITLSQEVIDKVVALTVTEPPHEATHWTAAAMAKAVGISVSSVTHADRECQMREATPRLGGR